MPPPLTCIILLAQIMVFHREFALMDIATRVSDACDDICDGLGGVDGEFERVIQSVQRNVLFIAIFLPVAMIEQEKKF